MIPQKGKFGPWIAGLVIAVFAFQNPEKAASLINQFFDAVGRFAGALG
ncbi:hypothetical protein [Actinomadura formosensis]|nr:hypothetical protein [Actinomadura formosensis]